MDSIIVILLIVLILLVAVGMYLIFFSRQRPSAEKPVGPVQGSVVNVRQAGRGRLVATFSVDLDDVAANDPVPFLSDFEADPFEEVSLLDRFRDKSLSDEERSMIATELRELGYDVRFRPQGGQRSEQVESGNDDGGPDVSAMSEQELVMLLQQPYADADLRARAQERLVGLRAAKAGADVTAPDDGDGDEDTAGGDGHDVPPVEGDAGDGDGYDGDGGDDGDGYDPQPGEPDEEPEMEGMVDPMSLLGKGGFGGAKDAEPREDVRQAPAPAQETRREAEESEDREEDDGPAPGEGVSEEVIYMDKDRSWKDDDVDSQKAMRLMVFISKSFCNGRISPELVEFAQQKLFLTVNPKYWTEEKRERAKSRIGVYTRNPIMTDMSIDKFDLYVRGVVEANEKEAEARADAERKEREDRAEAAEEAGREAEKAPEQAETVETEVAPVMEIVPDEETAPAKPAPVTVGMDARGGRNDLIWKRLEEGF